MNTFKTNVGLSLLMQDMVRFDPKGFDVVSARHDGKPKSSYFVDLDSRTQRRFTTWHVSQDLLREEMQLLMTAELQRLHPINSWDFYTHVPNCDDLLPPAEILAPRDIFIGHHVGGQKEEKGGGLEFSIKYYPNFDFNQGQTILTCEDVLNTGYSACRYIEFLRLLGGTCKHVLAFLDRQNGGREALKKMGVEMRSVFTISELFNLYLCEEVLRPEAERIVRAELKRINKYAS